MIINRRGLLDFYDQRHKWPEDVGSPISAIIGLVGEDLVLGLFSTIANQGTHEREHPDAVQGPGEARVAS